MDKRGYVDQLSKMDKRRYVDQLKGILEHLREITETTEQVAVAAALAEWDARLALDITAQMLDARFKQLQLRYMAIREAI